MSQNDKQWKKPTDILRSSRLKSQRRRSAEATKRAEQDSNSSKNEQNTKDADHSDGDLSRKRKNPFSVTLPSSKRAAESSRHTATKQDTDAHAGSSGETKTPALFSALNRVEQSQKRESPRKAKPKRSGSKTETKRAASKDTKHSKTSESDAQSVRVYRDEPVDVLPVDWSLKLKLRIVTSRALLPERPSVSIRCKAMTHFVHNYPMTDTSTQTPENVLHALQQCCHYWVHPVLPGFPEFPRIVPNSTLRKQVKLEVGNQTDLKKALYNDWLQSMCSVYQQLKTGDCPYFYLCCHQFTALFWGTSVAGCTDVTACLTPTTRGLRQALRREKVEFSMPNQKESSAKRRSSSTSDLTKPQGSSGHGDDDVGEDEDDDDITATDEGASQWLQDVGLDKKDFPTLAPSKVRLQREGYQQVDGRPESLVMCEGVAVHFLFNFIFTSKSITAASGPQAGIPPTILSPTAFLGGTLKSNRIAQSRAKLTSGTTTEVGHVIDISGPLLPHHVLNVCAMLQEVRGEYCQVLLNTHEPTVPLNFTLPSVASNKGSLGDTSMLGSSGTPSDKPGPSGSGSTGSGSMSSTSATPVSKLGDGAGDSLSANNTPVSGGTPHISAAISSRGSFGATNTPATGRTVHVTTSTPITGGTALVSPRASDLSNHSSISNPDALGTPIVNPAAHGSGSLDGAASTEDTEHASHEKRAAEPDIATVQSDTDLFSDQSDSDSDIVGSDHSEADTGTDQSCSTGKMRLIGISFSRKDTSRRESSSSFLTGDESVTSAGDRTRVGSTGTPGTSTTEPLSGSDLMKPGPSSVSGGQGDMSFSSPDIQSSVPALSDRGFVTSAGEGTQDSMTGTPCIVTPGPMSTPGGQQELSVLSSNVQGSGQAHVDRDSWEAALHHRVRKRLYEPTTLTAGTALKEYLCEDGKFWLPE